MITDVPGIRVGHATDPVALTGVTVVLCERPAVAGVELRGGANDVIGLDYLDPRHLVPTINAVVLGGGSRFGGESIWGVMRWLEERGVGYAAGPTSSPTCPARFSSTSPSATARAPDARDGLRGGRGAAAARSPRATSARARARGSASCSGSARDARRHRQRERAGGRRRVGALVAVNAVGDVRDPEPARSIAGTRDAPDGRRLIDSARALRRRRLGRFAARAHHDRRGRHRRAADEAEAAKVAALGMLGFAPRSRRPTPRSTATRCSRSPSGTAMDLTRLGLAAAEAVARAIVRGVRAAVSLPGLPAARDLV